MTDASEGNGGSIKVRVSHLEGRADKAEENVEELWKSYNDDRLFRAEWRGKLDGTLEGLKKDMADLVLSFGRRKSDRVKIWVAFIVSASALVTALLTALIGKFS